MSKKITWETQLEKLYNELLFKDYESVITNSLFVNKTKFLNSFALKYNLDLNSYEWKRLIEQLSFFFISKRNSIFTNFTILWSNLEKFHKNALVPLLGQSDSTTLDINFSYSEDQKFNSLLAQFNLFITQLLNEGLYIELFDNIVLLKDSETNNLKLLFGKEVLQYEH
ncbi:MSC_0623 family F1-like ATPase-associated protein [Mycoplasmopsis columbina]|uniref:MSC_0623 family F1-like ATPase-associated protein n=1 Tax=Mycoplasmopsis columbina TaxID=114881 RepID=UPI0004A6ECD6|nr:DUF2714 domain-containing protein [Mycoplasmopsis columbina]VEU76659.1 Protein of uncharacterised function (DUF2714) [Mycoplasmopsis columbina]